MEKVIFALSIPHLKYIGPAVLQSERFLKFFKIYRRIPVLESPASVIKSDSSTSVLL